MSKKTDLTSCKFGLLTAIELSQNDKYGHRFWKCKCECGNILIVRQDILRKGKSKSCGCNTITLMSQNSKKHGLRYTCTYKNWSTMKARCYNINNIGYSSYGGRGIEVCQEWIDSFESFYIDMGERPRGKSLDRINPNKGYSKENCRWATTKEQARNKRNSIKIMYKGTMTQINYVAEDLGITRDSIYYRICQGMTGDDILKRWL